MSKNIIVIVITLLLLPGCFVQSKKNKAALKKKAAFSFDPLATHIDVSNIESYAATQEVEAKLFDIPTMIGSLTFEPYNQDLEPGKSMIVSLSLYDRDMLADFYLKEMVRSGWLLINNIHGFEWLLLFQKPHKLCVINMRSCDVKTKNQYHTLVHITVCNTESGVFESYDVQ